MADLVFAKLLQLRRWMSELRRLQTAQPTSGVWHDSLLHSISSRDPVRFAAALIEQQSIIFNLISDCLQVSQLRQWTDCLNLIIVDLGRQGLTDPVSRL
jgi:hypothetical protein